MALHPRGSSNTRKLVHERGRYCYTLRYFMRFWFWRTSVASPCPPRSAVGQGYGSSVTHTCSSFSASLLPQTPPSFFTLLSPHHRPSARLRNSPSPSRSVRLYLFLSNPPPNLFVRFCYIRHMRDRAANVTFLFLSWLEFQKPVIDRWVVPRDFKLAGT